MDAKRYTLVLTVMLCGLEDNRCCHWPYVACLTKQSSHQTPPRPLGELFCVHAPHESPFAWHIILGDFISLLKLIVLNSVLDQSESEQFGFKPNLRRLMNF